MVYKLTWANKLWVVSVSEEITDSAKWTYAQAFAATGGDHSKAMMRALAVQYPGIGYGAISLTPVSFLSASHGAEPYVSASDTSYPSSAFHKDSQRPPHHGARPAVKDVVSGISGLCKPAPRPPTSNSSRPLSQHTTGPVSCQRPQQRPMQTATQGTGGWMGSKPTSV